MLRLFSAPPVSNTPIPNHMNANIVWYETEAIYQKKGRVKSLLLPNTPIPNHMNANIIW